jgi:hypothetical protein
MLQDSIARSRDFVGRWLEEVERDREATAYHEAGHVTAAVLLGLPVGRGSGATVSPQLGRFGSADLGCPFTTSDVEPLFWASASGTPPPSRLRNRLEAYVLAVMLGPFAEERAIGEGLAPGYETRALWRCPIAAEDEATRELADREAALIREAVAAAAEDAGAPAVLRDTERVWSLVRAASVTDDEACVYTSWLYERALTLLRQPRFWIPCCALAAALIEDLTVSGRRCVRIVRAALVPPASPSVTAEQQGGPEPAPWAGASSAGSPWPDETARSGAPEGDGGPQTDVGDPPRTPTLPRG